MIITTVTSVTVTVVTDVTLVLGLRADYKLAAEVAAVPDGIDWQTIGDIFASIKEDLSDFALLSREDFRNAELSWLTYGLIKSDFEMELRRGSPYINSNPVAGRFGLMAGLAYGGHRTLGATEILPPHIASHLRTQGSDFEDVAKGIGALVTSTAASGARPAASADRLVSRFCPTFEVAGLARYLNVFGGRPAFNR